MSQNTAKTTDPIWDSRNQDWPAVDRGEYNPSGTYWRKVAEALKKQLEQKKPRKR